MSSINVRYIVLVSFLLNVLLLGYEKKVEGQELSPEVTAQITQTVRNINQAFIRGDLETLRSLTTKDLTMLHGHMKRVENQDQALAEWKGLFSARGASGISYFIRESDFKVQLHGNVAVVTFNYEHLIVVRQRVATEGGKAVYVLVQQGGKWLMAHCSTIRNTAEREQMP